MPPKKPKEEDATVSKVKAVKRKKTTLSPSSAKSQKVVAKGKKHAKSIEQIQCDVDYEPQTVNMVKQKTSKSARTENKKTPRPSRSPRRSSVVDMEKVKQETHQKPVTMVTTLNSKKPKGDKYIGAHVSISGGLYKSVLEAEMLGARSFGIFLKNQRQWNYKPLEPKDAERFCQTLKDNGYSPAMVVPHGSYLMNCASPNSETLQKSRDMLVDELKRCEMLGLAIFNFHPGSTCGKISVEEGLDRIAESIDIAHAKTKYVITVLENMCRQGNTIGGDFCELRGIIERVKDKSRIGVCLDTCHAFAAGYDLKTKEGYEQTMKEFQKVVGFKYLKAVHINDSKGAIGCHADRHENIGKGKITLDGFKNIMNDSRFNNIPFVLETPEADYSKEIKKLYSLCK